MKPRTASRKITPVGWDDGGPPVQQGVLIVDDCDLMRLMIRLALERAGFRVWAAETGDEALSLYRRHRTKIAAVLLDVQMPGLDGPHTLDALLELNPDVRTCFVSGDTGDYEPEELIRRGAQAVFHKPFRLTDLTDAVHRMTKGEHPVPFEERRPELRGTAIFAEDLEPVVVETENNATP